MSIARSIRVHLIFLTLCVVASAETLEDVEKSATQWAQLQVETARVRTQWQEEKPLLESTLATLEDRAKTAEEKRDLAHAKAAKDREESESLRAKVTKEAQDLQSMDVRVKTLAARLLALRPNLPPRLADALEMSFRSLSDQTISSTERMQIAMNVINRCAQFNRSIVAAEDVITLPGEAQPKSLPVVYWGLAQGYAIDRTKHESWVGTPSSQGWHWEQRGDFAAIERLIAVANEKADPELVLVPMTIPREASHSKN